MKKIFYIIPFERNMPGCKPGSSGYGLQEILIGPS